MTKNNSKTTPSTHGLVAGEERRYKIAELVNREFLENEKEELSGEVRVTSVSECGIVFERK